MVGGPKATCTLNLEGSKFPWLRHTDYVSDGDPTNYEPTAATKGVIDLSQPEARAWLDVSASPNPVQIAGGQSGTVVYRLSERNSVGLTITSEPWVFVYPDGSSGLSGTDSDQIRVNPLSSLDWMRWPLLPTEVAQHVAANGWSSVILRYTFIGTDDHSNAIDVVYDLTIVPVPIPEFPLANGQLI